MSDGARKMLMAGAGFLFAFLFIASMFKIFNKSSETVNVAGEKIDNLTQEMIVADKTQYDDQEVSGSDVLNAITKFKSEELCVWVVTNKTSATSGTQYGYTLKAESEGKFSLDAESTNTIAKAKKLSDKTYINPSGKFLGDILYDTNDVIVGIKFVQQ